jgi:hypothetical protein
MTIETDLDRAHRAKAILDNPTYQESFELVRQAILEQWEATPIRDKDGAHELKLMLKLLGDVRANLERAIADGTMAAHELEYRRRVANLADFKR